jgi:Mn2+/Fe2+ NRAMP family transporter
MNSWKSKFKKLFKILGPGLVTGASDDDPSGIATYSQAGAAYGLSTLWTSIVAFPLMHLWQEYSRIEHALGSLRSGAYLE